MLDTKKMYTILIVFIVAMFFLVTGAVFYAKDSANSAEPVKEDSIEAPIEEQSPDITESDAVENTEQKQEETEVSVVPQQAETLNKEAYVLYLDHLLDKKWESICKYGSAELVASYEVAVSRDGRINSYKLNESGVNYAKYKNILTRVIKNLAPLKPLPNEFAGSEAVFKLEFMNEGTVLTSFIDPNSSSSQDNSSDYTSYLSDTLSDKWIDICAEDGSEDIVESFLLTLNSDGSVKHLVSNSQGKAVGKYSSSINDIINSSAPYRTLPANFENNEAVLNLNFLANGVVTVDIAESPTAGYEQAEQLDTINESAEN